MVDQCAGKSQCWFMCSIVQCTSRNVVTTQHIISIDIGGTVLLLISQACRGYPELLLQLCKNRTVDPLRSYQKPARSYTQFESNKLTMAQCTLDKKRCGCAHSPPIFNYFDNGFCTLLVIALQRAVAIFVSIENKMKWGENSVISTLTSRGCSDWPECFGRQKYIGKNIEVFQCAMLT